MAEEKEMNDKQSEETNTSNNEKKESSKNEDQDNRSDNSNRRGYDNRNRSRGGNRGGGKRRDKRFYYTKKVCKFCTGQIEENSINYKNVDVLKRYTMPSGKIVPRRISGNCARHQRRLAEEIKKARILALLPFVDR